MVLLDARLGAPVVVILVQAVCVIGGVVLSFALCFLLCEYLKLSAGINDDPRY